MKRMINLTSSPEDIERFSGQEDMREFLNRYGCDGFEYQNLMSGEECLIPEEMAVGVHLRSFNSWVDMWKGRNEALIKEYGSLGQAEKVYGGSGREALIRAFRKDLEFARKVKAEYVVFHICEVTIEESYTYQFAYTDEEVAEAACELINELLDGQGYEFYFLMENLWWPGLTFTKPEITKKILDGVHYNKKGFMLDTGHLMHTNLELKTQEEACRYVREQVKAHGSLAESIRGIHLNQSLTGEFVKQMLANPKQLKADYYERWCQVFGDIFSIELHQPFTASGTAKLIEDIAPDYLTYELISRNRQEHEALLSEQVRALSSRAE